MWKLRRVELLEETLKELGSVAVAFSGGVDSTFLLYVAIEALGKENVMAITVNATATPERDLEDAIDFVFDNEIKHEVIKFDQLAVEGFKENKKDRCYICKKAMYTKIKEVAAENGFENVIDGTNFGDWWDFIYDRRPGVKALLELEVRLPLVNVELRKPDIRKLSEYYGLESAYKESSPCLATRIKCGNTITEEKLKMIDDAEEFLLEKGYKQVRVRMIGKDANVEVRYDSVKNLEKKKYELEEHLKKIGFEKVEINPNGYYEGRMNG